MALISPPDQQKLREAFAEMTRSVRLLFFTQTLGCETCLETRQILDELPVLSDKIAIEEVNVVLEPDKAKQYGVDRAPAVAVTYEPISEATEAATTGWTDSRIRFLGAPAGYEFISLVQAVLLAGGRPPQLSDASLRRLAAVDRPVTMQVFTTPT
jgi:alkyl hydroperoxide reductase subunit AhpF